jgi:hypothetical protein
MNSKQAKTLRRMARLEMSGDQGVQEREIVIARKNGHDVLVNNPGTNRAMYRSLKLAYLQVTHARK